MKFKIKNGTFTVLREVGDITIRKESTFWYHVLQKLKEQGEDVIRKCPAKDNKFQHMTSAPYYIRSRKPRRKQHSFWIVDNHYAVRCPAKEYLDSGSVELAIQYNIFDGE